MPRTVIRLYRDEQLIHWSRAFLCGVFGSWILAALADAFTMMGLTNFSFEVYLGNLLRLTTEHGPRSWIVGLIGNSVIGGLFGIFYGYFFEDVFKRADPGVGALCGLIHAVFAAVAVFPFFETVRSQLGLAPDWEFGFFGASQGPLTPLVLLVGHLLFGLTLGTLYGPVRARRVRARRFEPGEMGLPGEARVITPEEDPADRAKYGYL